MTEVFGTVLIVVCLVAVVFAVASFWGSGKIYEGLGHHGGLSLERPDPDAARPSGGASAQAEADEEIRQMLEAKSARREARGQAPLDVEAELAALRRPPSAGDEALREEVRQLVIARNERRLRRGKAPLDVESEVDRQLRELGA
jgi:hypothetical protein